MSQTQVQLAEASYHRCNESGAFYSRFYQHLLASSPRIPPMFARTEFERQHRLLKHALGLLIIYAKRANPSLLDRIADRHLEVGVGDDLYPFFVESLVRTVAEHDPEYTPAIGEAWRVALAPGLEYMRSRNERRTA
ncbi:MAG TPA: globin domain-containing protein [Gemmatimonadales bacterium]|nr:globin domain-containing protein [Gemmatimonadales bacterium]